MRQKSTQNKLIAMGGADKKQEPVDYSALSEFSQHLIHYPDAQEAAKIIQEQAAFEFTQENNGELEKIELLQTAFDEQHSDSHAALQKLDTQLNNTKQFIKSSSSPNEQIKGFMAWRFYDQLSMVFLVVALVAALVMSSANVYANIMASGQQVFVNNPSLAVFMSLLMPAGSAAIKFFTNFLDFQSTRKRYALLIYTLTALSLLVWMVYFATQFTGVSGDFNWETLGEPKSNAGSFQVFSTLIAELLVAASLFLAAEDIYLKYAPNDYTESAEYLHAKKARDTQQAKHDKLNELRAKNHAHITQLEAKKQSHMNLRIAEYLAMRHRISKRNQD